MTSNIVSQANHIKAKNTLVPSFALRHEQSDALFVAQVVR